MHTPLVSHLPLLPQRLALQQSSSKWSKEQGTSQEAAGVLPVWLHALPPHGNAMLVCPCPSWWQTRQPRHAALSLSPQLPPWDAGCMPTSRWASKCPSGGLQPLWGGFRAHARARHRDYNAPLAGAPTLEVGIAPDSVALPVLRSAAELRSALELLERRSAADLRAHAAGCCASHSSTRCSSVSLGSCRSSELSRCTMLGRREAGRCACLGTHHAP